MIKVEVEIDMSVKFITKLMRYKKSNLRLCPFNDCRNGIQPLSLLGVSHNSYVAMSFQLRSIETMAKCIIFELLKWNIFEFWQKGSKFSGNLEISLIIITRMALSFTKLFRIFEASAKVSIDIYVSKSFSEVFR